MIVLKILAAPFVVALTLLALVLFIGGWQQPPFVVSKGGLPTATTYFKKHKISKGETVTQSLKERFDYGQNPDKTQGGELISSYECDYMTADAEFLLSKAKYKVATGREQRRDADVLCYQIRQSFKPGEISPEEAATKRRCAKQRASTPFSLPPTQTASIFITTSTTTPLRWIAPTSSGISSARPERCGGFLTECVWKMTCP